MIPKDKKMSMSRYMSLLDLIYSEYDSDTISYEEKLDLLYKLRECSC